MNPSATGRYLTPPAVARRLGVKPERVIRWIKRGELKAINVSDGKQRPRYRISAEALAEFERRRAVVPPPEPAKRRRRRDTKVTDYF